MESVAYILILLLSFLSGEKPDSKVINSDHQGTEVHRLPNLFENFPVF